MPLVSLAACTLLNLVTKACAMFENALAPPTYNNNMILQKKNERAAYTKGRIWMEYDLEVLVNFGLQPQKFPERKHSKRPNVVVCDCQWA